MNSIGIRQGRLSPAGTGPIQRFPWRSWKDEFAHARRCGFGSIEWLFAADDYERNPIWTDDGREDILTQIADTGIRVDSVCADYFMAHPFFRVPEEARRQSVAVLNRLVVLGARVGIRIVVVPVLEASEVRTVTEIDQLLHSLTEPLALAATYGIRLGLETELPGPEYLALVEQCPHPALGVCYDTGNAAAKGYDVAADVRTLAPHLCEVHVKDRTRGGPSVRLGQGDADFEAFLRASAEVGYQGPLIVEAPVGDEPIATALADLAFLKQPR